MHQSGHSRLLEIENWLYGWMSVKSGGNVPVREANYIEAGILDSLNVIELIEGVEREYNFKFSSRDFQDRRFVTVSGLAEIIHGRLQQA